MFGLLVSSFPFPIRLPLSIKHGDLLISDGLTSLGRLLESSEPFQVKRRPQGEPPGESFGWRSFWVVNNTRRDGRERGHVPVGRLQVHVHLLSIWRASSLAQARGLGRRHCHGTASIAHPRIPDELTRSGTKRSLISACCPSAGARGVQRRPGTWICGGLRVLPARDKYTGETGRRGRIAR